MTEDVSSSGENVREFVKDVHCRHSYSHCLCLPFSVTKARFNIPEQQESIKGIRMVEVLYAVDTAHSYHQQPFADTCMKLSYDRCLNLTVNQMDHN